MVTIVHPVDYTEPTRMLSAEAPFRTHWVGNQKKVVAWKLTKRSLWHRCRPATPIEWQNIIWKENEHCDMLSLSMLPLYNSTVMQHPYTIINCSNRPTLSGPLKWVPKEAQILKKLTLTFGMLVPSPSFALGFSELIKLALKPQNCFLKSLNLNFILFCALSQLLVLSLSTFPSALRAIIILLPADCQTELRRHVSDGFRKCCWIRFW